MKLLFSESAVNFPSIGTHFCKKKVSGSRRNILKGVNVLTAGKAKNGRQGHSHCDGRFCRFFGERQRGERRKACPLMVEGEGFKNG